MKKITAYIWAFIVLILAFFTVGVCTLGSTKTTGNSMTVVKEKAFYYEFGNNETETLKAVYVNVGGIHTAIGEDVSLTLQTTTATSWSTLGSTKKIGNVTSTDNQQGASHNWIALVTSQSRSANKLSFKASANLDLNEIVAINSNNEIIELKPYVVGTEYSEAEVAATLDAQESFARFIMEDGTVALSNDAKDNFTQEEGYYMSSVQNVLSGKAKYDDAYHTLDGNFNYLATLLMTPAVAVFGNSVFALRLTAFIATTLLIVFAFLLVAELTKSEQLAFYFSIVLMAGGLVTTVGRFGAPYTMVACAVVASAYFMYRFFAHGISSKDILHGGLNVLFSGMFAATAMAMDITAAIPVIGVLALFMFGLDRQRKAYRLALEKTADQTKTITDENGETVIVNKAAAKETEWYLTKNRVCYGFAALSFVVGTLFLLLFAAVLCYSAYVRATNDANVNFLAMIWEGIKASAGDNGITSFTAANTSALSWILPYKPATLYTGVVAAADGSYIGWHVLPNAGVMFASAAAFVVASVKVLVDLAKGKADKQSLRMRRTYFVLLGGMALALLAGMVRGNMSALNSLLFHTLYLGFLPLVGMLLPQGESTSEKVLINVALCVVVAVFAMIIALSLPALCGYTVAASRVKWFDWLSIFSNGFFKI